VDNSIVRYIRDCGRRCLRRMLLDYLGDDVLMDPGQATRCCAYCNPDISLNHPISFEIGVEEDRGKSKGKEVKIALQKALPQISVDLRRATKEALEGFRMKKVKELPEGALIHGLETSVFGDLALEKVVAGMKEITCGDDVKALTHGMIYHYADEVAAIVCKMRETDAASNAKKRTTNNNEGSGGSRKRAKKDQEFQSMLSVWRY
jgi:hypothetical protein